MVIQIVKFQTTLSEDEVLAIAKQRLAQFQSLPGLIQKYYVKVADPDQYGGIYLWDSVESFNAYRESDLAATIAAAYKVNRPPSVEIFDTLFQLRV